MKNCDWCKAEFKPYRSTSRFCCNKCRRKEEYGRLIGYSINADKCCSICGSSFHPKNKNQIACSSECSYKLTLKRSLKNWRIEQSILKQNNKPRECLVCGDFFVPKFNHKDACYCSESCKMKARNNRRRLPVRVKKCIICHSEFNPINNVGHQKTCSRKCAIKHGRNLLKYRKTPAAMKARIANSLRGRIVKAIKVQGAVKKTKTEQLLGCSVEHFMKHIEKQFAQGMSWSNWSFYGWHMDHIIPCSHFDLTKISEQRKCFNFTNLQPLWRSDNMKKSNRLNFHPAG